MSVYFRKSVSAGPIRFNLNKTGIGISTGVKGFRVGSGVRGGYVHAGRGGIYYRRSLGSSTHVQRGTPQEGRPIRNTVQLEDSGESLEGVAISELVDATPSEIVQRIQEGAALPKPWFFANPFSYKRRKLEWHAERAVPLFYELESDLHEIYDALLETGLRLGVSPGRYYDSHEVATDPQSQYKGHGGASTLLDRSSLVVCAATPPAVSLNFEPLEFTGLKRSLFLLPDQALLRQGTSYAAIPYLGLQARVQVARFITDKVPKGVSPVDSTWQYVNKKGGPDRRYKENREIPIIEVAEIDFLGPGGFEFHTAFTDFDAVDGFSAAFEAFKKALPD